MLAQRKTQKNNANLNEQVLAQRAPQSLNQIFDQIGPDFFSSAALTINGQSHSFASLDGEALRIANFYTGQGVTSADRVALVLPKSTTLFTSVMAAIKIGASFVVIDPAISDDKKRDQIKDTQATVVLAANSVAFDNIDALVIDCSEMLASLECLSSHLPLHPQPQDNPEDLAFFVGGHSINKKKSVALLRSLSCVYGLSADDVYVQSNSVQFDVAIVEMLAVWSVGAAVVIDTASNGGSNIAAVASNVSASIISLRPEELAQIDDGLDSVKTILVSGEKCASALAVSWALRAGRLISLKDIEDSFASFVVGEETGGLSRAHLLATKSLIGPRSIAYARRVQQCT